MSSDFQFKQFKIKQQINPQKVGTDSMLLGAWSNGHFKRILDVGTGTGILALMLAQQNPEAIVTAIEPDANSLLEAEENFSNSPFKSNIQGILSTLQNFQTDDLYDLIICNPPYFENSTLSENPLKNSVRHNLLLKPEELYTHASSLLSDNGFVNVIIPFDIEKTHISSAEKNKLFPFKILRTIRDTGEMKRSLISFSFSKVQPEETKMIVKFSDNFYSKEYVELTKDFYLKDLSFRE
jgi:tRNA1Val (adenine37-N6)-methyltransferase